MRSQWMAALLAFLAGVSVVAVVGVVIVLIRDSGGDDSVAASPTATSEPYPVLEDGQFIDSLPQVATSPGGIRPLPLTYGASKAAAIAVVTITGVEGSVVPSPGPGTATPMERSYQPVPWTTYKAQVEQWIKGGNGETDITLAEVGGIDYDGARLLTASFLAQVGRTYLIVLDPSTAETPAPGQYFGALFGWANFEVGDGAIHVLNEANSWRFMGAWNGTPLDQFIADIHEWMNGPPSVTPTPPPTPTARP